MSTTVSRLDQAFRSFALTKFFSRGWGCPENMKRLFEFRKIMYNRETCLKLVDPNHKISIDKVQLDESGEYKIIDGHFQSPFAQHLPGLLPKVAETAYFQLVVPADESKGRDRPICIHMAGTGDHFYWKRRTLLAKPLLKDHGISSLILENPFYGLRKPEEQFRSSLLNVSDVFVMGGSLLLEGIAIFQWCEKEGFSPQVVHGISMGGHMASLAAVTWGKPICLVPCLSWSTASGVFTQGVMSGALDWKSLESQFLASNFYKDELYKMVWNDYDEAYQAGKDFVAQYKSTTKLNTAAKSNTAKSPQDQEKSNVFQGLTTFLRDRGLLKILPDLNNSMSSRLSEDIVTEQTVPKDVKHVDLSSSVIGSTKSKVQKEAIQFMRGVMDEFTHLKNFSKPVDPSLIIVVAARNDAYVPRDGYTPLDQIWPGCEVRFVDGGHVSAYILHQGLFKKAIAEAVDRYRLKYHSDGTLRTTEAASVESNSTIDKKVAYVVENQNSSQLPNDPSSLDR